MYTLGILNDIGNAIMDGIRTFMLTLCDGIYRLIYFTFYIFEKLGTASILQDGQLEGIFTRMGLIIGIFMVFRVTFAFIQYIVDPDTMLDKNKGMGNIVKKIVIAIVLLGSTTSLFKLAYRVQDLIVDSHIISKVIFNNDIEDTESFGGRLSAEVFTAFYRLNDAADTAGNDCEYYFTNDNDTNIIKENIAQKNGSLDIAYSCITERDNNNNYIVDFDGGGFIALVMGAVVLYTVAIFTIQVGVRLVQLAYLQIIAPIPIIMYITPKGDDYLKKWGTQCLTTFLDFFLRTAIIYFAVAIIQNLMEAETLKAILSGGGEIRSGWQTAYVFVIMVIAILVFAKKVPALLKEIFPSLGGAASFDYGLSFKKQVVEPLKTAYNSPLGWGLKLGKNLATHAITEHDRKKYNLPAPRNKLQQKLDKLMPGRAEAIKNVSEGAKEVRDIDDKWNDGVKLAKKFINAGFGLYGTGENGWDKALDGKTKENYRIIFNSDEFINSKMNLDRAKKDMEKLRDGLLQVQSGGTFDFGGVTYNSANVAELSDKYNSQSGVVSGLETVHNSLRKQYANDAAAEDKFKFIKNNQANPAEPSHNHTTEGIAPDNIVNEVKINTSSNNNQQPSNIIVEEHVGSRPRQEANAGPSPQEEYSRLVNQYNSETDPNRKAEIKRQLDDFESGKRG